MARWAGSLHGFDATAIGHDPLCAIAGVDLAATFPNAARHFLPHLPGSEFRIKKLVDERSLGILLPDIAATALAYLLEGVEQRRPDGNSFDTLRAPLRTDLVAGHAPDLFRVGLEKREIQLPAEA